MQNVVQSTVISQFANSPALLSLVNSFNDSIDPTHNIDAFVANVWNINTAVGYGLDFWGRIVGVKRALYVPGSGGKTFGFKEETTAHITTFGIGAFFGGVNITPNYSLGDAQYRRLILVKAFSNISDRSIRSMNASLLQMFPGRGNAYVADAGAMTARLTFNFSLTSIDLAIVLQSGAFAGPTGVNVTLTSIALPYIFTFSESGTRGKGFGLGAFYT